VDSNLTNLVNATKFVADDENKEKVKEMIHNANQWCRSKFFRQKILKDMLDVLVQYSDIMDSQDKHWRESMRNNLTMSGSALDDWVAMDGAGKWSKANLEGSNSRQPVIFKQNTADQPELCRIGFGYDVVPY